MLIQRLIVTSLVTQNSLYFPGYFQVKGMNPRFFFMLKQFFIDNVDMTKI